MDNSKLKTNKWMIKYLTKKYKKILVTLFYLKGWQFRICLFYGDIFILTRIYEIKIINYGIRHSSEMIFYFYII